MTESDTQISTIRQKVAGVVSVVATNPQTAATVFLTSIVAALLEGVGIGFLIPIIEVARNSGEADSDVVRAFESVYTALGIPFTLEFIIVGVGLVMTLRYTMSFVVAWLKAQFRTEYVRGLQADAFEGALDAEVGFYDETGADQVMNTIVTEAKYSGEVVENLVRFVEQGFLSLVYFAVAAFVAPWLTVASVLVLGFGGYVVRSRIESGYDVGSRIADANEEVQHEVQAGTQGIRDVKLYQLRQDVYQRFQAALNKFVTQTIVLARNRAAMDNVFQLAVSLVVFVLIYVALSFTNIGLSSLGLFLFALFRLAPRVSTLNNILYRIDGNLPHLFRTKSFINALDENIEQVDDGERPPTEVNRLAFDDVSFSYDDDDPVLRDVSFSIGRDEFIAFAGPSGAGKSTIVSLLAGLYTPNSGDVCINGRSLEEFNRHEWRSKISVVRQQPYIFNDTLRFNITFGRDVSASRFTEVCEVAQLTEFVDGLSDGYETVLGEDGVKLSGGQRQRVSIARALLRDTELLVLDEATSNLDATIEEKVQSAIEGMESHQMMIAIAHRLSTIRNADRIYMMEQGEIVESGPHRELMTRDSSYASLYKTQVSEA